MSTREGMPEGWTNALLADVLQPLDNGKLLHHGWSPQCEATPSPSNTVWGVLKTTAIQEGRFLEEHNKSLPDSLEPRPNLEVKAGDVLLTCAGPRNRCGIPSLVRHTRPRLMLSGKMYRFRPRPDLLTAPFLEAFLLAKDTQIAIDAMKTGISDSGLNLTHDKFLRLVVPIPPLAEQHRVMEKMDELFSDLDAGVASLQRAKANLKRYRAAVLKVAVEGSLTEEWRKQHPQADDGQMLLDRILRERREKWEQDQLAGFAAKGKEPPKNWQTKYEVPIAAEPPTESPLPTGWTWATLDAVTSDALIGFDCGRQHQTADGKGCPYIKMNNVTLDGRVLTDELVFVPATPEQQARYSVRVGDLLFNTRNSVELVGKTGLVRQAPRDAVYNNNLMRLRTAINSAYLCLVMCSAPFRSRMEQVKKATTSVAAVYGKDLFPLAIPIPPIVEQDEIVRRVDERFSQIDAAEATIDAELIRSKKLRQGILKQAFDGKIVPQAPGDEPASLLLDRIRDHRTAPDLTPTSDAGAGARSSSRNQSATRRRPSR